MKTKSTLIAGLIFIVLFPASYIPQTTAAKGNSIVMEADVHPDYVSQLLNEINAMRAKAQRLRVKAETADAEEKINLIVYAEHLEKKSYEKQQEALQLDFSINFKIFASNKKVIDELQQKNTTRLNYEHIQYLLKESGKNMKLAKELFQEIGSLPTIELKIGQLGNAEEKALQALEQQNQVMELLRKTMPGLASKN